MRRALLACLLLAGCASDQKPPVTVVQTVCIPLKSYSLAQEQAVAAKLAKLPDSDLLAQFMADYGAMRSADRACLGAQK